MKIAPLALASFALLGSAAAWADEPAETEDESEILFDDVTCADLKAMIAEVRSAPDVPPPPPSPECAAVCIASQLATCAVNPRACGGNGTIVLGDYEEVCLCREINQSPADAGAR